MCSGKINQNIIIKCQEIIKNMTEKSRMIKYNVVFFDIIVKPSLALIVLVT